MAAGPPNTGPSTGRQLVALKHLDYIAERQFEAAHYSSAGVDEIDPTLGSRAEPRWPLLAVLAVQTALSLRLVWSNTAFTDEALYLWAGHLEWASWLHGPSDSVAMLPTYFSGAPVVYPPLGALADSIGGLAGARILSLAFMLGATSLLYATTRRLFGQRPAIFAIALFAALGPTQFLGALATYDAMALFLLALGTWTALRAAECGRVSSCALLALAGVAMALADLAKYASTLFDPIVVGVAALALWRSLGARRAVAGIGVLMSAAALVIGTAMRAGGREYWLGVTSTTLARANATAPIPGVLFVSAKWIGPVALLAVCGAAACLWSHDRHTRLLSCLLAMAVFLAPAEQARIHTVTSLFKHVDYGSWFGCIVAGYALAALARAVPKPKARNAVTVSSAGVLAAAAAGIFCAGTHFAGWPNSTSLVAQMRTAVLRDGCPCIATDNNIFEFYMPDLTFTDRMQSQFDFVYWDSATRTTLSGVRAYQAAIAAGYFGVVEIDPSLGRSFYAPVVRALTATHAYRLASVSPSGDAGEPAEIWELDGMPA